MRCLLVIFSIFFSIQSFAEKFEDGTQKQFFDDGKPKYEVTFKNGKKNGSEIF